MEQPIQNKPRNQFSWMFLVVLIAVGAAFGYSRYVPGNDIAWAADVAAARAKAAETGRPILMEFSASWCPTCNAVKRNVWPVKRVEQFVNDRAIPLKVDVDEQPVLSAQYHIDPIPAFVMTDPSGRELARAEGYLDGDGMIALIESAERKLTSSTRQAVPLPPAHPAEGN